MSGQGSDKAGVFYLLIEVADKGTACHVAADYFMATSPTAESIVFHPNEIPEYK